MVTSKQIAFLMAVVIFNSFMIQFALGVEQTPEEIVEEKEMNKNTCGYLVPSTRQGCAQYTNAKTQCCSIFNAKLNTFACMPQSATPIMNNQAQFNIDGANTDILCGTPKYPGTFFGINYCGKKWEGKTQADCAPLNLETNCCFMKSVVNNTNIIQTFSTCIAADSKFNDTITAQTLFAATDSYIECRESGGDKPWVRYNVTNTNSRFLIISVYLISFLIIMIV